MPYVTGYLFISEDFHLVVYKHLNAVALGCIKGVQLPFGIFSELLGFI